MNIIDACKQLEQGKTVSLVSNSSVKIKCDTVDGNKVIYATGDNVPPQILLLISNDFKVDGED